MVVNDNVNLIVNDTNFANADILPLITGWASALKVGNTDNSDSPNLEVIDNVFDNYIQVNLISESITATGNTFEKGNVMVNYYNSASDVTIENNVFSDFTPADPSLEEYLEKHKNSLLLEGTSGVIQTNTFDISTDDILVTGDDTPSIINSTW